METLWRKPILVGGIGLYAMLWFWQSIGHSLTRFGEFGMLGAIALGFFVWAVPQKSNASLQLASRVDRSGVDKAIASCETMLSLLATEAPDLDIKALRQQLLTLTPNLDRKSLKVTLTGGSKVGKTSLKQLLVDAGISTDVSYDETEGLFQDLVNNQTDALDSALNADLVLFVTNGDLTDSEWQSIQKLQGALQSVLVVLNKEDQFIPEEKNQVLQHIRQRLSNIIPASDVISCSCYSQVKVRQHQEDGTVQEWTEKPQAEISEVISRLGAILTEEKEQLVLATTWREAQKLKIQIKEALNEVRKQRALPVIEKYQWLVGGASFANPVAALDLVAAAAINGQMVADLSEIYQQKLNLEQAQRTATTLAKVMVKLGLVELSTGAIASILKTNAITYVAGGALQGISAAYLTRVAGLSLVEYLEEQEVNPASTGFNLSFLGEKMQKIFQENTRGAFLQGFVKQALSHFTGESKTPQAV